MMKKLIPVIIVILFISATIYVHKNKASKNEERMHLPVNLSRCKLVYNIFDHIDYLKDAGPEFNTFFSNIIPTPRNIRKNSVLPLMYEKVTPLKGSSYNLHAIICFPSGGSDSSYFNIVIDSQKLKYYILHGLTSGSVFETEYLYMNDQQKILCYGEPLSSPHIFRINSKNSLKLYPFYLYDLVYEKNDGGIKSVVLNVGFSKRLLPKIDKAIQNGFIYFNKVVIKNNKELRFIFLGKDYSPKAVFNKKYSFDIAY